jgi:hypothetical protein
MRFCPEGICGAKRFAFRFSNFPATSCWSLSPTPRRGAQPSVRPQLRRRPLVELPPILGIWVGATERPASATRVPARSPGYASESWDCIAIQGAPKVRMVSERRVWRRARYLSRWSIRTGSSASRRPWPISSRTTEPTAANPIPRPERVIRLGRSRRSRLSSGFSVELGLILDSGIYSRSLDSKNLIVSRF